MTTHAEHTQAARTLAEKVARDLESRQGIAWLDRNVGAAALPQPARDAGRFYRDLGGENEYRVVDIGRLPPEAGSALLILALEAESTDGSIELYSPAGELWAAGVFFAGFVAWMEPAAVREIMAVAIPEYRQVCGFPDVPRPTYLEWIMYDARACTSVGGRFLIHPESGTLPTRWLLHADANQHPCESLASAQTLAAEIHARG